MALSKPWEVSSKPKPVPVYADGERIGTAESASVNLTGFYGPIESVELTGLRDRPVPVSQLQASYDVMVRDRKIEELEAEVERLNELRKEQSEKHKQKMRNLQQNFEQQSNGKTRSTQLKKQLEQAKSYSHRVERINEGLRGQVDELQAKLDSIPGRDTYWHEKYLESEGALDNLRDEYVRLQVARTELARGRRLLLRENKKLVDDYNRLNDDINRFMEDFSKGANTINRAVEDWNATVPE